MTKYVVDTNVFLRLLSKDDERSFSECKTFLEKTRAGDVETVTTNLTMAETLWTLESFYGWSKKEAVQGVASILGLGGLRIVDGYRLDVALKWYESIKVKFIDAMVVSIKAITDKEWIVVSYDADFDKLGVTRKEPSDVVP